MAILLKELPLLYASLCQRISRIERRARGQIINDGIGFSQIPIISQIQQRDLAVGIARQEILRPGLTGQDIHLHPLILQIQQVANQLQLVAIPRLAITVDFHAMSFA